MKKVLSFALSLILIIAVVVTGMVFVSAAETHTVNDLASLNLALENAKDGDIISIDLSKGTLVNKTTGEEKTFEPFKEFMLSILEDGGLVNHYLNEAE